MVVDIQNKSVYGELTSKIPLIRAHWDNIKESIARVLKAEISIQDEEIALKKCNITLNVSQGGTTVPAPGIYQHDQGTIIHISAVPDKSFQFLGWIGDVTDPYRRPLP